MRGGIALVKATWASWVQYRSFFFILAFGWMIQPLIYLLVWTTAAGGKTIGGMSRGEFVAYYLVLILVNQITYSQANWTVGDLVRYGQMNRLLIRPLSPFYDTLSSEMAGKVVYMIFDLPIVLVLALIMRPEMHATLRDIAGLHPSTPAGLGAALLLGLLAGIAGLLGYAGRRAAGLTGFAGLPAGRAGRASRIAAGPSAHCGRNTSFPLYGWLSSGGAYRAGNPRGIGHRVCSTGRLAGAGISTHRAALAVRITAIFCGGRVICITYD